MSGYRRRLTRGSWLQLIVLRVLYEKPLHGYKLLEEVNSLLAGRRKMKPGSLYTILRRMENSGLLDSNWEKKTEGLDRRVYNLTEKGVEVLREGKYMIENQRRVLEEMSSSTEYISKMMKMSDIKAIQAYNLTKYYNDFLAVDHISFDVDQGEIFGFLGPNGAGKSTTIRMLTGISTPTEGTASILGYDIIKQSVNAKSQTGIVPDISNIYTELTA